MIRRQMVMPVSPERLWEALTEPAEIAGWFGGRLEWDLVEGGSVRFHGDDGNRRDGRIDLVRPGRHLRFRWWPAPEEAGDTHLSGGNADEEGTASEISYSLQPDGDGTRLTVQERPIDADALAAGAAGAAGSTGSEDAGRRGRIEDLSAMAWSPWDTRLLGAWASTASALAGSGPIARA